MITCVASAKPEASFSMRNLRTGLVTDGAFLPVEADLSGTTQTIRCSVQNVIFNRPYLAQLDFEVKVV